MSTARIQTWEQQLSGHKPEAVATEANVSFRTVERFLAGKPLRPAMEKAILDAIVRLTTAKASAHS